MRVADLRGSCCGRRMGGHSDKSFPNGKEIHPADGSKADHRQQGDHASGATNDPAFAQPSPSPVQPTSVILSRPAAEKDRDRRTVSGAARRCGRASAAVCRYAGLAGRARDGDSEGGADRLPHGRRHGQHKGPSTQSQVADKMVTDFTEGNPANVPSFFYHLGDGSITSARPRITTISSTSRTAITRRRSSGLLATTMA